MDRPRSTSKHRKKWDQESPSVEMPVNAPAIKQEVLPQYGLYLSLLQEKNRLLKQLRRKDKLQVDQERKEKGFSIYINGANQDLPIQNSAHTRPRVKTATESRNPAVVKLQELQKKEAEQNKRRVKTAPARERRRNWNLASVDINTTEGSKRLKAPEILTGKYADDFEEIGPEDDDDDSGTDEVGDSLNSSTSSLSTSRRQKVSYLKRKAAANREVQENMVTLTLDEVHKLRQSLQKNAGIRQSMCLDVTSVSHDGYSSEPFCDSVSDQSEGSGEEIEEVDTLKAEQAVKLFCATDSENSDSGGDDIANQCSIPPDRSDFPKPCVESSSEEDAIQEEFRSNFPKPCGVFSSEEDSIQEEFRSNFPKPCVVFSSEEDSIQEELDFPDFKMVRHIPSKVSSSSEEEIEEEFELPALKVDSFFRPISCSEDEEIDEELYQSEDESEEEEHEVPIQEEDEIEEDLVPTVDSLCLDSKGKKAPLFAPNDTIVLEFAPPANRKVEKKVLMLARKKEADSGVPATSSVSSSSSSSKPPAASSSIRKSSSSGAVDRASPGTPAQAKSRLTLSAGRRSSESKEDSKAEASAVMKALQEENQQAARFAKESRPLPEPRKSRPGSGQSQGSVPSPKVSCQEPESREEDAMTSIVQRVLAMAPRHQRDLLKTLSKIDDSASSSNGLGLPGNKAVSPTPNSAKKAFTESDKVEVRIEIVSNWGHRSRVGLTEIQLVKNSGSLMPVPSTGVTVHGAHSSSGPPSVLFNGRAKTTKERNMWVCQWTGQPVELRIQAQQSQLAAVRLWNWNKSIMELDIGVRHVRVFVDKQKVFDGEMEKGCGNHVFDYSKTIPVTDKKLVSPSKLVLRSPTHSKPKENGSPSKAGSQPPHSPLPANSLSQRALASPLKGGNPSVPNDGHHHTFRSISRSSASSASSSGSHPSRPSSQNDERGQIRSETRTLVRPTLGRQQSTGSDRSSPEVETDVGKESIPEKISKTPRLTKRMAARLDRKSSDTDTSRSNTDSVEQKPPLPPDKSVQRSGDKMFNSRSHEKLAPKTSQVPPVKSPRASSAVSTKSSSSQQDRSRAEGEGDASIVDKLKDMGTKENKRKKDIPRWLSSAEAAELKEKSSSKDITTHLGSKNSFQQEDDEDIQSLLDEELAIFSQSQAGSAPSTPKPSLSPEKNKAASSEAEEAKDEVSPMQQIEKKRSKWRTKQTEDLEDTWGSLSFFNKSHRGRLSLDMADDILDEYLAPPKKPEVVTQLPIPEEGFPDDDDNFVIPELPTGRELVINIQSTWGDRHYVGLTSLQVFASTGEPVVVQKITADPLDINILPEYDRDPRVVGNLLDGINRTRDDTHMWLAPFTPGKNHFIYLTFSKPYNIAFIRIWNYNKSRIHSYRGAKDVSMTLDDVVIFKGEIARACGGIEGGTEAFGDIILFTTDAEILEAVSKNDDAFEGDMLSDGEEDVPFQRPSTADNEDDNKMTIDTGVMVMPCDTVQDRPFTRAAGMLKKEDAKDTPRPATGMVTFAGDYLVYKTHKLELNFTATWGDMHYLGLTALEVVGKDGEPLAINMGMLSAKPQDIRHFKGHEQDDRTLDKLIDGSVVTMSDEHMWLIPFTAGQSHTVTVTFPQETLVSGLRIWNYNKSPEDTYRGARIVHVSVNDRVISPAEGFLVRKGPGNCHFDFAQEINFMPSSSGPTAQGCTNGADTVQMPCGFIYQLQLFSTWGDPYYVGLNGIEFYDTEFNKIPMTESDISAHPNSVNVLEHIQNDVRTPDKLIDGVNDTMDGRHMWLAPILPGMLNRVYVIFDQPTTVSMIKIWNYSKTPLRGVKDFALLVDDLLVYNGTLQAEKGGARGILPTASGPQRYHTILFTDNTEVLHHEKNTIINSQTEDQDVQLLNNKKIVAKHADPNKASSSKPVNQALRPKTGVTGIVKRQR